MMIRRRVALVQIHIHDGFSFYPGLLQFRRENVLALDRIDSLALKGENAKRWENVRSCLVNGFGSLGGPLL
jgi:hypothetical protein